MKIVVRILALPFYMGLSLLYSFTLWVIFCVNFIRFGGEAMAYTKKTRPKTITDVFLRVEEMLNNDQNAKVSDTTEAK